MNYLSFIPIMKLLIIRERKGMNLCAVDLNTGFNTVINKILLQVLQNEYAVGGSVYSWCKSCLPLRTFVLKLVVTYQQKETHSSVLEGSVAGPQFFNIYASTLFNIIPEDIGLNSFADVCTIHDACNLDDRYECMSAMHSLENTLLHVEKRMSGNSL